MTDATGRAIAVCGPADLQVEEPFGEKEPFLFARAKEMLAGMMHRSQKSQLADVEAELVNGWSFAAYDKLRRLAEDNSAEAQFRLGQMYERAEGVIQNLPDAVQWYRLAAERGHAPSQNRLGLIYFIDPPEPASLTPDEFERFSKVQQGDTMLESSFPNGLVVSKDYVQAAHWNRLAAEAGVGEAQARYGLQFAQGLGLDRDLAEAERWFAAAAAQGEAAGQVGLGVLYAGVYGTQPDFPRAVEWLAKAAEAGSPTAQYWLGLLFSRGEGVPR